MTRPQHQEKPQTAEIRRLYDTKCPTCGTRYYTYTKLAEKFGTTRQRISRIINNKPKI